MSIHLTDIYEIKTPLDALKKYKDPVWFHCVGIKYSSNWRPYSTKYKIFRLFNPIDYSDRYTYVRQSTSKDLEELRVFFVGADIPWNEPWFCQERITSPCLYWHIINIYSDYCDINNRFICKKGYCYQCGEKQNCPCDEFMCCYNCGIVCHDCNKD